MSTVYVSRSSLAAALCFASDKDIRYYLNGVMLEVSPHATVVCATDGHILFAHREVRDVVNEIEITGTPKHVECIIARDDVKRILRDMPKRVDIVDLTFDVTALPGGKWECAIAKCSGMFVDGKFPDWRRVVPDYSAADCERTPAQFNPELLVRVQKAFIGLGSKTGTFALMHRGPNNSALCVSASFPDAVAVIMPWREGEGKERAHAWIADPHAAPPAPAEGTAEAQGFKIERIAA